MGPASYASRDLACVVCALAPNQPVSGLHKQNPNAAPALNGEDAAALADPNID